MKKPLRKILALQVEGLGKQPHPTKKFRATETKTSSMTHQPNRSDRREGQQMTPEPPMKLLSTKACVKIDSGKLGNKVADLLFKGQVSYYIYGSETWRLTTTLINKIAYSRH